MLAPIKKVPGNFEMSVRWRNHAERFGALRGVLNGIQHARAALLRNAFGLPAIQIAYPSEVHAPVEAGVQARMLLAERTRADHSHLQSFRHRAIVGAPRKISTNHLRSFFW